MNIQILRRIFKILEKDIFNVYCKTRRIMLVFWVLDFPTPLDTENIRNNENLNIDIYLYIWKIVSFFSSHKDLPKCVTENLRGEKSETVESLIGEEVMCHNYWRTTIFSLHFLEIHESTKNNFLKVGKRFILRRSELIHLRSNSFWSRFCF